jgi:hypothetical protein
MLESASASRGAARAIAKARGQQLGDPEIGARNRAAAYVHAESCGW